MSSGELQSVETPRLALSLRRRFYEGIEEVDPEAEKSHAIPELVGGFEDILGEELGSGFFYNTPTSTHQLMIALAVAPNPLVGEVVESTKGSGSRNLMKALRVHRVLSDFKLLDLGCGVVPGFALAAKSMGAEVHTADVVALGKETLDQLDSHTVVDLTSADAIPTLQDVTGGNLDFVTSNIIWSVPGRRRVRIPDEDVLRPFGEYLLKVGGHFMGERHNLLQKT